MKCANLGCDKDVNPAMELHGLCPRCTMCLEDAIEDEMKDLEQSWAWQHDEMQEEFEE